jgi:hypothetical protein
LRGEGEPILVDGQPTAGVVGVAYQALAALSAAFPEGLTRQQLNEATGSKDARRALQYLERLEPWKTARVIVSAGGVGKTPTIYRLRATASIPPS